MASHQHSPDFDGKLPEIVPLPTLLISFVARETDSIPKHHSDAPLYEQLDGVVPIIAPHHHPLFPKVSSLSPLTSCDCALLCPLGVDPRPMLSNSMPYMLRLFCFIYIP